VGTASLIFDVVLGRWEGWVVGGCLAILCSVMFLVVPAIVVRTPEPALLPEPESIRRGPDQPEGDVVIEAGSSPQDD
jgi:hypothetical protein